MRWAQELGPRQGNYRSKYAWRAIAASGTVAVLRQGDDFEGSLDTPINAARDWAKRHGFHVESRRHQEAGEVFIRFSPRRPLARTPTWIEKWAASGGHARGLNRRGAWFAARWAYKHNYGCVHLPNGKWRLVANGHSAFSLRTNNTDEGTK